MRLGGLDTIRVDVRIIAATNADLEAAVQQGTFREDLFYRLNVITVTLPPLRKRTEDMPLLAQHFLAYYARENEKAIREISPRAMELLLDYSWPGNVRELENVIERAVVLSTGEVLIEDLLPASVRSQRGEYSPHTGARYRRRPAAPPRAAAERLRFQGRRQRVRAADHHPRPPVLRRRAEAGRGAVAGQAHHAPRDDEDGSTSRPRAS